MFVGNTLKKYRQFKKLKQKDVAEMLGVSRSTYTNYETSSSFNPDLLTTLKFCEIFGVSINTFLDDCAIDSKEFIRSDGKKYEDDIDKSSEFDILSSEEKLLIKYMRSLPEPIRLKFVTHLKEEIYSLM